MKTKHKPMWGNSHAYLSRCVNMTTWQGWDRIGWAVPVGQKAAGSCCDLWPLQRGSRLNPRIRMGWCSLPKPDRRTQSVIHLHRSNGSIYKPNTPTCKRQVTCSSSRRCLVRACSTSQPDAVEPVPKPVPLAQYSCCSSVVPPTCPLETCG